MFGFKLVTKEEEKRREEILKLQETIIANQESIIEKQEEIAKSYRKYIRTNEMLTKVILSYVDGYFEAKDRFGLQQTDENLIKQEKHIREEAQKMIDVLAEDLKETEK